MNRTPIAWVVERNIHGILPSRKLEERKNIFEENLADKVTRFTGSMRFVDIHPGFRAKGRVQPGWLGLSPFDILLALAMFASAEAILLSIFCAYLPNA